MASEPSGSSPGSPPREAGGGGGGGEAAGGGGGGGRGGPVYHPHTFKLRFAAQREPGRSNVSLVKPLGLPAIIADKWYAGAKDRDAMGSEAEEAALRRVRDAFRQGPRDKYPFPKLTSHEVGWWWAYARPEPKELRHHIRDSWWLRERVRRLPPAPLYTAAPPPRKR